MSSLFYKLFMTFLTGFPGFAYFQIHQSDILRSSCNIFYDFFRSLFYHRPFGIMPCNGRLYSLFTIFLRNLYVLFILKQKVSSAKSFSYFSYILKRCSISFYNICGCKLQQASQRCNKNNHIAVEQHAINVCNTINLIHIFPCFCSSSNSSPFYICLYFFVDLGVTSAR
jgi:hypothetical protein